MSLAHHERLALCDVALEVGEDAPTLCGDWTVRDLVVHLLVRERSLVGAPGIWMPALSGLTDRETERIGRADFALLVDQLRRPRLTWAAIPAVDKMFNAAEFFVHHEDIRRAQSGWEPRDLSARRQDALWKLATTSGRMLVRPAGVPVRLVRSDTGDTASLRSGDGAVVTGLPSELVMFLYGRNQHRGLEVTGDPAAVEALHSASLGI